MQIQWYPGHMAKAKREVQEKLKLVDFVIELVDARTPVSSQNPMLQEILGEKQKLIVLMKSDLADPQVTEQWVNHFEEEGNIALSVDVNQKKDIERLIHKAKELGQGVNDKRASKGVQPRAIRAMIIGIPNVGKSTLINRLANKKRAEVGDKPGVTKKQQWIKIRGKFELLDTPGILWPKFEEEEVGYKLATTGSIKDTILHLDEVVIYLLKFLKEHYPTLLEERYGLDLTEEDVITWFDVIGKKRGCLQAGGVVDYEKTSDVILRDFRSGKLGRITMDRLHV
ncbi:MULTISPECIES: ribosome biogenesis GTPase YlqF [Allobacillus]|uniref:Ribosome biogenesis GTPase A n=1 Tax=Allobacillus halotolerans TaxID=570278 RepID=A0ABS6GS36_9BACI|nr:MULTISPECIES: ribosome biogenesis GTPase YlqF [Allobacillus]MBU6081308.1 ribosome biogenesis GTPase YlqF [Allobacillus halotolerans]TSJ69244.1 ribosome biogenesis GTPase YlqF [Allobacillus sp. SKP2-8]